MKKGVVLILIITLTIPTILATVTLNEKAIEREYLSGENLRGSLNLEIIEEPLNSIISSSMGGQISLESFLEKNGASYTCQVPDCSNEYIPSYELTDGQLQLKSEEDTYIGIVLKGESIKLNSISFDLESDFGRSDKTPLSLNFFEKELWNYNEFSDEFSAKVSGCYDSSAGNPGPLIGTEGYCEKIPINTTAKIKMEARVTSADDNKEIIMELYEQSGTSLGGSPIKSCTYNPGQGETDCTISADDGESFASGDYYACIRSSEQTNYKIYDESDSQNCGFLFSKGPLNSIKDFAISLSFAKYENASKLDSSKIDFDSLAQTADNLIDLRYGRDCSNECVIPIEISGINQNLKFSNISIYYQDSGGIQLEKNLFKISKNPPIANFSGDLELEHAKFQITTAGTLSIFFNEEKLTEAGISLISAPVITQINPLTPPAGTPIEFTAITTYAGAPTTIEYFWDFGDGETATTQTNKVTHTYNEIKDYVLTVRAISTNAPPFEKSFRIFAQDPFLAINKTLYEKKYELENLIDKLNKIPKEYRTEIKDLLEVEELQSKLTDLEKELKISSRIEELSKLGEELYGLNIPTRLESTAVSNLPLVQDKYKIDASPIATAEGIKRKNLDNYREKILEWQSSNVVAKISSVSYNVELSDGEKQPILRSYLLNIRSKSSQEGFIAIYHPSGEIFFEEDLNPVSSGDYSIVPLGPKEQKVLKFYILDTGEIPIFVSPKLSNVILEDEIDTTCNYNLLCEEELGESPTSCRTDCKPTAQAGFYLASAIIFLLIFYTALQIWYKRNYENYLFGNKRHLYNLLMYVANAQARGMSSSQISENLRKHGWSKERIRYAIRKANGQSNGLYEIIPVDKIMGAIRERAVKRDIARRSQSRLPEAPKKSFQGKNGNFQQKYRKF